MNRKTCFMVYEMLYYILTQILL